MTSSNSINTTDHLYFSIPDTRRQSHRNDFSRKRHVTIYQTEIHHLNSNGNNMMPVQVRMNSRTVLGNPRDTGQRKGKTNYNTICHTQPPPLQKHTAPHIFLLQGVPSHPAADQLNQMVPCSNATPDYRPEDAALSTQHHKSRFPQCTSDPNCPRQQLNTAHHWLHSSITRMKHRAPTAITPEYGHAAHTRVGSLPEPRHATKYYVRHCYKATALVRATGVGTPKGEHRIRKQPQSHHPVLETIPDLLPTPEPSPPRPDARMEPTYNATTQTSRLLCANDTVRAEMRPRW